MASLTLVPTPPSLPYTGGLFAAAAVVDADERVVSMGASYQALGCTFPSPAPGDCWISIGDYTVATTKSVTAPGYGATILNFPVYAGVQCFADANADYDAKALQLLEAGEQVAVERIFYNWMTDNAGASLTPPTNDVTSAFGTAEFALAGQLPTQGIIHANRYVTNLAIASRLVDEDDDKPEGVLDIEYLETIQGTPVANGGGYQADPTKLIPTAGEAKEIFITGGVTIYRGQPVVTRAGDWTHNREMAIAERMYAIAVSCNFVKRINFT